MSYREIPVVITGNGFAVQGGKVMITIMGFADTVSPCIRNREKKKKKKMLVFTVI